MLLSDHTIHDLALQGMITPFAASQVRQVEGHAVLSFGCNESGYDIRLGEQFALCPLPADPAAPGLIDVKHSERTQALLTSVSGPYVDVPPNSFVLGHSIERFRIPAQVKALAFGKSSYARVGINPFVTPLEAGWGLTSDTAPQLTIQIVNSTPYYNRVYAGEGIVQLVFFQIDQPPAASYTGRYNEQSGVTLPRIQPGSAPNQGDG